MILLEFNSTAMRRTLLILLLAAALPALAQTAPPKLEPLPVAPPPPPGMADGLSEPRVDIPVQKEDKVEPVYDGGRLVMIKITPPGGEPYFLVDTTGSGNWIRRDPLDGGVRVPMWTIRKFD